MKIKPILNSFISFFLGALIISLGWYHLITSQKDSPPAIPVEGTIDSGWTLIDHEGVQHRLGDISKKKLKFINIWATWCGPCIGEMPGMEALYHDYGDKIEFLFVSREELAKIDQFRKQKKFDLPFYKGDVLPDELKTSGIPATFIVGPDGSVIFKHTGSADWNHKTVRDYLDTLLLKIEATAYVNAEGPLA